MNGSRWIIVGLLLVFAISSMYVFSNPDMAARYGDAVRDSALSTPNKDLLMCGLVVVIGGYLAWFLFKRRD